MDNENRERTIDWRDLFKENHPEFISYAEDTNTQKGVKDLRKTHYMNPIYKVTDDGKSYDVWFYEIPSSYSDNWDFDEMNCECRECYNSGFCKHEAAALYAYEKKHGLIHVRESDREKKLRLEREAIEQLRQNMLERSAASEECSIKPMISAADDSNSEFVFYDLEKATSDFKTNKYFIREAEALLKDSGTTISKNFTENKDRKGNRTISGKLSFHGKNFFGATEVEINENTIIEFWDSVDFVDPNSRYYWYMQQEDRPVYPNEPLNHYELITLKYLSEFIGSMREEDQTDKAAERFFAGLEKSIKKDLSTPSEPQVRKKKNLDLACRIIIENGDAQLGFKAGRLGDKLIIVKNLAGFAEAIGSEGQFELSKKVKLDFSQEDFRDECEGLLSLLVQRVADIHDTNVQLESSRSWYSSYRIKKLSVKANQPLRGAVLDRFYESAEGSVCEYTDKTNGFKDVPVSIGYTPLRFTLRSERLSDARGNFAGVSVSGIIPVTISGSTGKYILNNHMLSRISKAELESLQPFSQVADSSGYFRFQVGKDRLQEFYYRVIPALLESPCVNFIDDCADEAAEYLPPEPVFVFYFDYRDDILSVKAEVSYDDRKYSLMSSSSGYRDIDQEGRVLEALKKYCPNYDIEKHVMYGSPDDDELYGFLTSGVELISRYGDVRGTDAFSKLKVSPTPVYKVGISVESGLMNLSVTSKDVSEDELLEIYESYRQKKRYHKLRAGDYISLNDDRQLYELEELLSGLDLTPMQVIRENIHLPLYRALYLDRMLEDHEAVATSRDRTYRALIRNFNEVRDSDYEVPEKLSETMRPYQTFGHKWLRTIENAGFGGILADEMGLGKTLELISVFLAAYEEGNKRASLVVVPASVVYNWQEEVGRFAPDLQCITITGTVNERKKIISGISKDDRGSVYITSYDLLKRDVSLYEGVRFYICALDEAQIIKNQKAAVTKAVKVIKSDHRFALTGTPIENRLSELWSIFDFLMPGFLYTADYFQKNFERAITKEKDKDTTAKLKRMVSPFILRRKKEDVLKDLPDKLEEVSYARLSGEQQRIYDAQVAHMKKMLKSAGNTGQDRIKILAELTRIRQICCDPSLVVEDYTGDSSKRQALMDLVERAIDGDHRMLIFSQFVSMLELIQKDLEEKGIEYYIITGQTPKEKRLSLVRDFNNGSVPVFLISLRAGGTGLNLTGADVVIHYDPWWNLAVQNQATDRAHRIGQTRQVTVFKMITKDTIEERIMELQDKKKDLADAILEGTSESLMSLSNEELLELLE